MIAPDGLCFCLGYRADDLVKEDLPLMQTDRWALHPPSASRDAEVHALFNDPAVMLPFLAHLHLIPDEQWAERRQRHRAGFSKLTTGPVYMDLIWKESGRVVGTAGFPRPADLESGSVEWGINVYASHQQLGVCGEVFDQCCDFARGKIGVAGIVAETDVENVIMREFLAGRGLSEGTPHAAGAPWEEG